MEGLVSLQPVGSTEVLYLAFAPGKQGAERAARLDAGIRSLRQSGELGRILARYGLGDWKARGQ
jgi:polar amino acid transport system substrate-binding protein